MARTASTTGVTASVRDYVKANAGTELATAEIAEALGLESSQVSSALQSMVKQEQVRSVRRGVWIARQRRRSSHSQVHARKSSHPILVIGEVSDGRLIIEHNGVLYAATPIES